MKNSFQVTGELTLEKFNQTDFGRIYYNMPSEFHRPKDAHELAKLLGAYNRKGIPVTIRNTGHSVNGQTLTDGVQVSIGRLRDIKFDERRMRVTVGAGASWHEVLQGIGFPKYCLPVFPNNPHQEIQIGGTAAVGGIGPYSTVAGGFWNLVEEIKLVTMTGKIITCSKTKNYELMQYALTGFGRVGVVAELTLPVVKSKQKLLVMYLLYRNLAAYYEDLIEATKENHYDGIVTVAQLNVAELLLPLHIHPYGIMLCKEVSEHDDLHAIVKEAKERFRHTAFVLFGEDGTNVKQVDHTGDLSLELHTIHKRNLVYMHPQFTRKGLNQLDLCQAWSDHIVSLDAYPQFIKESEKIINKYGMAKYVLKQPMLKEHLDFDIVEAYLIRNIHKGKVFPLSLDLHDDQEYYMGIGLNFEVPSEAVAVALEMTRELTALVYALGGKRYMYGIHNLSKEQIEEQYGAETIRRWNELKKKHDPKHLLNLDVIEHLD